MAPVLALLGLGLLLRPWLGAISRRELSRLLFYVFLPALLIDRLAQRSPDLSELLLPALLGSGLALAITAVALRAWRQLPAAERAGIIPCTIRFNGAFVGLPIMLMLTRNSSEAEQLVGDYLLMLASLVPVTHFAAIIGILVPLQRAEQERQGEHPWWQACQAVGKAVATNPVIIACSVGVGLGWFVPGSLSATTPGITIHLLGQGAVPLALLVAGASIDLSQLKRIGIPCAQAAGVKLMVMPALAWLGCWMLAIDEGIARNLVILMGCPVAAGAVAMAQSMGAQVTITAAAVALTTLLAPFTLSLWLLILG